MSTSMYKRLYQWRCRNKLNGIESIRTLLFRKCIRDSPHFPHRTSQRLLTERMEQTRPELTTHKCVATLPVWSVSRSPAKHSDCI